MNRMDFISGGFASGTREVNLSTTIHLRGTEICVDVRVWERSIFESGRTHGRVKGKVFRALAVF